MRGRGLTSHLTEGSKQKRSFRKSRLIENLTHSYNYGCLTPVGVLLKHVSKYPTSSIINEVIKQYTNIQTGPVGWMTASATILR
jgi:hypothetical protein